MIKFNLTDKITNRIVKHIPNHEFKGGRGEKFIHWFGRNISTPENRLIIGVTALMTQPFIDLYNKDVDDKTQKVSFARTVGRCIAGMTSGFLVRKGCIKLVEKCSVRKDIPSKAIMKIFTPPAAIKGMEYAYKNYQRAMGMLFAIGALIFTNFAFDAPVTNFLTNKIVKKIDEDPEKFDKLFKSGGAK